MADIDRWLSKVEKTDTCWIWKGSKFSGKKRGQFWFKGTNWFATRAGWTMLRGPIPEGNMLCHHCDNEECVNPDHLYIGTQATNMWDRNVRNRTSRWDKRYNFVQTPELEEKVKAMRFSGMRIEDICAELNIGRTTYYRMRVRGVITDDREIARANYRRAAAVRC